MSGDYSSIATTTLHVVASKPHSECVYPISPIFLRAIAGMSTYVEVEISPATTTRPVVISVSHATRPIGSCRRISSRTASEIWSAILSGWPSVTDSDVNRYRLTTSSLQGRGAAPGRQFRRRVAGPPISEQLQLGCDFVEQAVGDLRLGRSGQLLDPVGVDQAGVGRLRAE